MRIKPIVCLLILLLIGNASFSQKNELYESVQSLSQKLKSYENLTPQKTEALIAEGRKKGEQLGQDSLRCKIELAASSFYIKNGQNELAWQAATNALSYSLNNKNYNQATISVLRMLSILNFEGQFDSMLVVIKMHQHIINKATDRLVGMAVNDLTATALDNTGKPMEARSIYLKGLAIAKSLNDTENINRVYINIGNTYSENDSAVYWYKKCLEIDVAKTKLSYATALYQIAFRYYLRDDVLKDSALYYSMEAHKRINDFPSPIYKGMVENALGAFFADKREYNLALPYLQRAYSYVKNIEAPLADMLVNSLAICHTGLFNFDSAQYYLNQFKQRIEKNNNDRNWMHYYQAASGLIIAKANFNKTDSCTEEVIRLKTKALYYAKITEDDRIAAQQIFQSIECVKQLGNSVSELAIKKEFLAYCEFFKPIIASSVRKVGYCNFLISYATLAESIGDDKLVAALYKEASINLLKMQEERYDEGQNEALIKYKSEIKDAEIANNKKVNLYLTIAIALLVLIVLIVIISQVRTIKLNKKISLQKQELEMQKEDLENVNKVKDRLFSVISHDMRTPLSSIISFIHILEHQNLSAEKMLMYTSELKNKLFYTSNMMDNLLNWAYSQMHGYKPVNEDIDLKQIAISVSEVLTAEAERKQITIVNNVEEIKVFADINMTTLIIRNLLSNAIKYTPQGGKIWLTTSSDGNKQKISISDDGIGLSLDWISDFNDQQKNTPLPSTKGTTNEKGTGIGLMLCKSFGKLMDVEILASNNNDKGAYFTVVFSS
ncbi:MAG: tetratricopeptide repeat-containing sensor histidine kinase [Bacteroidia bacterium]|nr:tetratricopeptide repeat-containing sensor histidine kinase [Bacteroidia bacterium]MBP9689981.1 tetratricopeptide repeat-containing sensor histidine kinase [Bacteroidia bacterium]